MTDDDDIDGLAAEYVLGSLHPSERKVVDERRVRDVALSEAIKAWERRLDTLSDRLPGVAPPADLYARILTQIAGAQSLRPATTIVSRPRARRQRLLVAGIALAACLLVALGWIVYVTSDAPAMLVAQLHRAAADGTGDEAHLPAFAVAIDPNTRTLTIRPVAIRPVAGKTYALWLVQKGGATPILLGSVSPSRPSTLPWLTNRPLGDFVNSSLTISLEHEGSPPTRLSTGPIAFVGTLVGTDGSKR